MYSVQYVIKVHGHTEVFVTRVGQSKLVGGLTMCQLIKTPSLSALDQKVTGQGQQ